MSIMRPKPDEFATLKKCCFPNPRSTICYTTLLQYLSVMSKLVLFRSTRDSGDSATRPTLILMYCNVREMFFRYIDDRLQLCCSRLASVEDNYKFNESKQKYRGFSAVYGNNGLYISLLSKDIYYCYHDNNSYVGSIKQSAILLDIMYLVR